MLCTYDADCDYVTPLCSQVTYEGLLDDTFGINSGLCSSLTVLIIVPHCSAYRKTKPVVLCVCVSMSFVMAMSCAETAEPIESMDSIPSVL